MVSSRAKLQATEVRKKDQPGHGPVVLAPDRIEHQQEAVGADGGQE